MIFFGSNTKAIFAEPLPFEKCPHCQSSGTVEMQIFGKYAHVYWIPVFPIGKSAVAVCTHCKHAITEKEMPSQLKMIADDMKRQAKPPLYFFAGLGVVGLLVLAGIFMNINRKSNSREFIAQPLPGDLYKVKDDERHFTLYKVQAARADTVFFLMNTYSVSKLSELRKINLPENFEDLDFSLTKLQLDSMLADGQIFSIVRE